MTLEELKEKEKHLLAEYEAQIRAARLGYLKLNTLYKIGDILEDHCHIIQVSKITYTLGSKPDVLYQGIELKANLTPKKRQDSCIMYQQNVKIHHESKTPKKGTKEV